MLAQNRALALLAPILVSLMLAPPASALSKNDLLGAVEELRSAANRKIDLDVRTTATVFNSVKLQEDASLNAWRVAVDTARGVIGFISGPNAAAYTCDVLEKGSQTEIIFALFSFGPLYESFSERVIAIFNSDYPPAIREIYEAANDIESVIALLMGTPQSRAVNIPVEGQILTVREFKAFVNRALDNLIADIEGGQWDEETLAQGIEDLRSVATTLKQSRVRQANRIHKMWKEFQVLHQAYRTQGAQEDIELVANLQKSVLEFGMIIAGQLSSAQQFVVQGTELGECVIAKSYRIKVRDGFRAKPAEMAFALDAEFRDMWGTVKDSIAATRGALHAREPENEGGNVPVRAACKNLYHSGVRVLTDFGAAHNLFTSEHEPTVFAECEGEIVTLRAKVDQPIAYIYRYGYEWKDGKWQQLQFSGHPIVDDKWYIGEAYASFYSDASRLESPNYVVAYICNWVDGRWKCGCRDKACRTQHWQLQAYQWE